MDYYRDQNLNNTPESGQRGNDVGFGIASMILGIVSVLLFCTCLNWITAILAIIFGIIQIVKKKERGFAIAGIITAGISLVLWGVLYMALALGMSEAGIDSLEEFYQDYYNGYYDDPYDSYDYFDPYDYYDYYDYYDGYDYYDYYDDYDDYYYYEEGGQQFLSNRR